MKIAALVKQIPDQAAPQALDPDSFRLVRSGKMIIDDSDSYGVEASLQVAEKLAAEVSVVSMAPNQETAGVRTALAMGAASAIVVSDDQLAGADALLTARVLAAAVVRTGAELVVAATESTDGYTGTVPAQVAALLGWPALTFAKEMQVDGGTVRIKRQTEDGFEEVEAELPAVVSVTAGSVVPRYPSFKGIMGAKNKPVELLTLGDLGIAAEVGERVTGVRDAEARAAGEVFEDDGSAEERIVAFLEGIKVL